MVEQNELPFFIGAWKGQGVVEGKGITYNEATEFKVLKTSPITLINLQ